MTGFSPVVHRHDTWLKLRDLAEEILTLTDEWREHDPELEEIDQVLEQEPEDREPCARRDDDAPQEDDITW